MTYVVMLGAALAWLWMRDRGHLVREQAGGDYGLVISLAVGTAVGLALTGVFSLLVRHVRPFTRLETALHDMLGSLSEREITVVSLFSALGEEFFFRLAMQDAIGLYWSAAIFGLLHFGPKGTMLWTVMAFVLGLGFGWMVELGCGLLSVTVAHALVNYLSLRRMNDR